ncbi:Protein ZRG17 [Ceratocystis lukuohia]
MADNNSASGSPQSSSLAGSDLPAAAVASPFNFQPQELSTSPVRANIGQRRGHRYKHSSVSAQHQIFQEPPQRPPPVLPASLPVPTFKEARDSMSHEQRIRALWCLCHLAVAVFVFFESHGSLAMMALSHLVFFDAGSAAICVAVDVLGNFEVWRRSSIRHPFGLERAEVLAGFAMSVFLLFGGFDLVSHNVKHFLSDVAEDGLAAGLGLDGDRGHGQGHNHGGHGGHSHPRVSTGAMDWASLAAIISTLISAYGLRNHARIAKAMRVSYLSSLPSLIANPFHFLAFCFSALLLLMPVLSIKYYSWMDHGICAAIALAMFALGFRLAIAQGLMLLMSYGGTSTGFFSSENSVPLVVREIESEPEVAKVEDAQFCQVHYGLGLASLKLRIRRSVDDQALGKLRTRISNLVQNRLGEGYGQGSSLRWEVTLQTTVDMSLNH